MDTETWNPFSQLSLCCGLNRRRGDLFGFNPAPNSLASAGYFYNPSIAAHLNQHTGTWPMVGANAAGLLAASPQAQPYLLVTQAPVIFASNQQHHHQQQQPMFIHHQQHAQLSQFAQQAPAIMSSQYAIYANSLQAAAALQPTTLLNLSQHSGVHQIHAQANDSPVNPEIVSPQERQQAPTPCRKLSSSTVTGQPQSARSQRTQPRVSGLGDEVFRQIETLEKHLDLMSVGELDIDARSRDTNSVRTRAVDPQLLAPHLTESMLRNYHGKFLMSDQCIVRFVEIIKRPGQTLGLYIRTVQFESPRSGRSREGLAITKIESDSPIYNSPVLHIGDEILSINLIEVQKMSLDDIVVLMSIPRRLLLALRISRDRDQLLQADLSQQRENIHQYTHNYQRPLSQQILAEEDETTDANYERERSQHVDSELAKLEREAGEFRFNALGSTMVMAQKNSMDHTKVMPSTLPRRTLPQAGMAAASTGFGSVRSNIVNNIRLGDTPEQSSYFSSSIEAINRELKELRRQRMALSSSGEAAQMGHRPATIQEQEPPSRYL